MGYDFREFPNVNITGIDLAFLSDEELSVLYAQAKYCQAMTDADIEVMRELVSEDKTFTHMSGLQQTREDILPMSLTEALITSRLGSQIL